MSEDTAQSKFTPQNGHSTTAAEQRSINPFAGNQQSSTLLNVIQSYFQKLLDPAPAEHTVLELEQRILSEGVELLATARKANDQPAVDYLTSLLQQHISKGEQYFQAYQSALTVLNPIQTAEVPKEVEDQKKPNKHNYGYPKLTDSEISTIVGDYKSNPKEWYSEKELVAILKHNNKLPYYNIFKSQIKVQKLIKSRITRLQGVEYKRESIENFLDVMKDYSFVETNVRDSISSRLRVVNWKVYAYLEHPSLAKYVKSLNDLFGASSRKAVFVYKTDSYEKLVELMKDLVDSTENVGKDAPASEAVKTKKPRKPKASNGNGVLLDWSGIEKHFGLGPGVIVGTDRQDKIEDILGSPEVPKDGQPGYLASVVESKRKRILAIINS